MRNFQETIDWYKTHRTAKQIGFDPDGMCLKVCRVARGIGPKYGTAKEAQDATPEKYRVRSIRALRRGMVLYFDDPKDSNKAGHIVTMIGRVKGGNPDNLHDILVVTNSVKKDELVVVRASYFKEHWGDQFQFGATWLNGHELDYPRTTSLTKFHQSKPNYNVRLLEDAVKGGRNVKNQLDRIVNLAGMLPLEKHTRVGDFVRDFRLHRVLQMDLLDEAIEIGHRGPTVRKIRDGILAAIRDLPRS